MNNSWVGTLVALLVSGTLAIAAQQPPGARTGNPTPGTPQPEPPNLADRITLTGCVKAVDAASGRRDANNPTESRFVLENAERRSVVPPDTGTSAAAASA